MADRQDHPKLAPLFKGYKRRCTSVRPPRSLAIKWYTDIRRWTELPASGHFAAMEQPEALVREIVEFFRPLRPRWP